MKVLFVPAWYPPLDGQSSVSGTFCREHVHAAAKYDDVAVLVFAFRPDQTPGLKIQLHHDDGIPTWYATFGRPYIPHTGVVLYWTHFWRALRIVVNKWGRPDVIHTQDHYAYPVMRVGTGLGSAFVVSQHWTGFLRGTLRPKQIRRFRWAFPRASRVLAANPDASRDYAKYGVSASVRWLPNAIDPEIFSPGSNGPREPWLLHASGFTAQKRFGDILKAFALVRTRRPDAVLQVAGDGVARKAMEALAQDLLPPGSFQFRGFLPKPELAQLMRRSRGFVFPSDAENLPCVLIEAMATGCPVLTTRVGGIPAMVGDNDGLFVDVGDIEGIRAGMLRLLDGRHGLDTERVAREARERFSRESVGWILHEEHVAAAGLAGS